MAQTTALSPLGTPGGLRAFTAKAAFIAPRLGITRLSVMATPGRPYSFVAKTASEGGGAGTESVPFCFGPSDDPVIETVWGNMGFYE